MLAGGVLDGGFAGLYFFYNVLRRLDCRIQGVVIGVVADFMTPTGDFPRYPGMLVDILADQEKGRGYTVFVKRIQERNGLRAGSVIECKRDGMPGCGARTLIRRSDSRIARRTRERRRTTGSARQTGKPAVG